LQLGQAQILPLLQYATPLDGFIVGALSKSSTPYLNMPYCSVQYSGRNIVCSNEQKWLPIGHYFDAYRQGV
jgi:hypothetical protein